MAKTTGGKRKDKEGNVSPKKNKKDKHKSKFSSRHEVLKKRRIKIKNAKNKKLKIGEIAKTTEVNASGPHDTCKNVKDKVKKLNSKKKLTKSQIRAKNDATAERTFSNNIHAHRDKKKDLIRKRLIDEKVSTRRKNIDSEEERCREELGSFSKTNSRIKGGKEGKDVHGDNKRNKSYVDTSAPVKNDCLFMERKKQKYKKSNKIASSPEDIVNSSLFRYINEYMYTNRSDTVEKKLNETKNIFNIYHMGYRNQKSKWPNKPLDVIIRYLKKNFTKESKIADLGCGEAEIAKMLSGWLITSFDLIKFNEYVTVSTLIIADAISRFTNFRAFVKFMQNVGFILMDKVNLDNFFMVLYFKNDKKDVPRFSMGEGRVMKVSKLLAPCVYKRR
ncbi:ribosomal RNA-processing protein 8, putative (RRP8) [Plasmodium ovale wallikeri]|uniref:Ribosomal RNA-processing protein 8 n=1 Tax=Plasmodium ovale wallikeri TaxID=864142 RepID=A0A1A8YQ12_PLAOA|nr:ribosomal RNA-processing protein 8, putative (RRP8) [Plasmodium ovale wallikeri]SBT34071.1 ribosomal RNA-processing protein 8, putative (RRP8) [Plasmodium ovale wallikeri]